MNIKVPLISIGITTYDRKELLIETINSIIIQQFSDFEIIVGNDNSNRIVDEEFTGIRDNRIRYINNETNLGEWRNVQNLFWNCKGKYFCTIADDDIYSPNFFSIISNIINKNNKPNCIFTNFTSTREDLYKLHKTPIVKRYSSSFFFEESLNFRFKVIGHYGVIKSERMREFGGIPDWEPRWGHYSDIWMTMFLISKFKEIFYVHENLIFYREHLESQSYAASDDKKWLECQKTLIEKSYKLIKNEYNNKRNEYIYIIIKFYCIDNYYNRLIRINNINLTSILNLYKNLSPYFNLLGSNYFKFILSYIRDTIKILIKLFNFKVKAYLIKF